MIKKGSRGLSLPGVETFPGGSDVVACALTPEDLRDVRSAWRKLFRLSLISREEVAGGLRLVVRQNSADTLRELIDIERECCRWITFELDGGAVMMTAPGDGASAIRAMWVAPE